MIVRQMLNQTEAMDRVFNALSDASRRSVVQQLSRAPATVSELAKPLNMSLPAVLQHLEVLENSGLIRSEKTGRVRTCHIEKEALAAPKSGSLHKESMWDRRLDRLGDFLSTSEPKTAKRRKSP